MLKHINLRVEMQWNMWDAAVYKMLSGFGVQVIKNVLGFSWLEFWLVVLFQWFC